MIVILLGAPGSGKGTQAKFLADKYGFIHLSTGDIFRSEMAQKTSLGEKAAEYVKSGRLVPDEIVTEMVAGRLELDGRKYLLDGFPRTVEQAQSLGRILGDQGQAVDLVILLNLSREEAIKRLTSRRICGKCGSVYNMISRPPKEASKCDACGGQVVQRDDDTQHTASKRLMVFDDLTQPLVAYYKAEQVFQEVDAAKSPEQVTAQLNKVIDAATAVN